MKPSPDERKFLWVLAVLLAVLSLVNFYLERRDRVDLKVLDDRGGVLRWKE
ncbi:MAG: hypothetical protein HY593_04035 [Candidatus Omnitrophica bacterium]|nr:hypothetical protein [Candidatus Omnitrophota bacterium]